MADKGKAEDKGDGKGDQTTTTTTPEKPKATMKAVWFQRYGGPSVLEVTEKAEQPDVGDTQVLVRVRAASVNPVDCKIRSNVMPLPFFKFPMIPGRDFSGVIEDVGWEVKDFAVGDEVFGMLPLSTSGYGTYAQYVAIESSLIVKKPSKLTHKQAAALPLVSLTAYNALVTKAEAKEDQEVLVLGASGGVGSIVVQLAKKVVKCKVTGVCSTKNVTFVKGLGADEVIDYTKDKPAEDKFDVVIDCAGDYSDEKFNYCKAYGVVVSMMAEPLHGVGAKVSWAARLVYDKVSQYMSDSKRYYIVSVSSDGTILSKIAQYAEEGLVTPTIDSEFPLEKAADAHSKSETRRAKGKIIINIP